MLSRGSVVLVPFPFTDLSTTKRRPALVVSTEDYNRATGDVIVAQITSRTGAPARPGDWHVQSWRGAGLLKPSVVRSRVTTLHSSVIIRTLGAMPEDELAAIGAELGKVLGIRSNSVAEAQ